MAIRFGEHMKVQPLLAPLDITETTTFTGYADLRDANWATLAFHFGAITCDVPTVTLMASTAATTTSAIAIAFKYRLSGVVGTDTMGDITAATTTGVALVVTDDGKVLLIEVDPRAVAAESQTTVYRYLRGVITPAGPITACVVGCVAYLEPKYANNVMPSS